MPTVPALQCSCSDAMDSIKRDRSICSRATPGHSGVTVMCFLLAVKFRTRVLQKCVLGEVQVCFEMEYY